MHRLFLVLSFFLCLSCDLIQKDSAAENTAADIIAKAIEVSGTSAVNDHSVAFTFRDYNYRSEPTCSGMKLSRIKGDTIDVVFRGKFKRFIDSIPVEVNDSIAHLYAESINSVHYFVQLPYRLTDAAVKLKKHGQQTLDSTTYEVVEVNFSQENGGEDFDDTYMYWFNASTYQLSFLAYQFHVNGGGFRFRVPQQATYVKGMQFLDYKNYKPKQDHVKLTELLQLYGKGELELVSEIETQHPKLKPALLDC